MQHHPVGYIESTGWDMLEGHYHRRPFHYIPIHLDIGIHHQADVLTKLLCVQSFYLRQLVYQFEDDNLHFLDKIGRLLIEIVSGVRPTHPQRDNHQYCNSLIEGFQSLQMDPDGYKQDGLQFY